MKPGWEENLMGEGYPSAGNFVEGKQSTANGERPHQQISFRLSVTDVQATGLQM